MIKGLAASKGIAIGKAFVLPNWELEVPDAKIDVADFAKEFERVYEGIKTSKEEIKQIQHELKDTVGINETQIFDAHLAILDDPIFMNEIQGIIQRQYKAAEVAVKEAIDHFVTMFDLLEDEYMKERALDIKDVGNRLLKHLLGAPEIAIPNNNQPFILVAKEVSPSQMANINPENVLGIVTFSGSVTSHSAIMARALNIPMVVSVDPQLAQVTSTGQQVIINGSDGTVYIEPSQEIVTMYSDLIEQQKRAQEQLLHLIDKEAVTKDGIVMSLEANISSLKELEIALANGVKSVGLFRTEFLYMDRGQFPTEDEQFDIYYAIIQKIKPEGSLVIRTLDIGGDKQLDYYLVEGEQNPFMGFRAIRISLQEKELFKTQLRAILRASAYGKIKILYPFVTKLEEFTQANALLEEAKRELVERQIEFDRNIQVGVMIEVPAAVMIADILADEVDFFSVGTNDLVQFTLAVDRMNDKIANLYEPFHPSIMRMLKMICDVAVRKNIPISVCGELAGDSRAVPMWLALGVRNLSMSAHSLLVMKDRLLNVELNRSLEVWENVLSAKSSEQIKEIFEQDML